MLASALRKFTNQTNQTPSPHYVSWVKRNGEFRTKQEQTQYLRVKTRREEYKIKVLKEYGGKCACCGEGNPKFLTIEHTNNDGYQHRRDYKGDIYKYLATNGFPFEFQILCYNCNCAKERNGGACPHKEL